MEAMNQDGDMGNEEPKNDESHTPDIVDDQLKSIADSGNVEADWQELQRILKQRFRTVVEHYIEKNQDCKEEQYQEPNVEKFNLEDSRDDIIELIDSFSEAPFTIQRICELLCAPFKYYDRISTFLRGLEKNLRVISSNDWPKHQVSESSRGLISNATSDITGNHVQAETSIPSISTTTNQTMETNTASSVVEEMTTEPASGSETKPSVTEEDKEQKREEEHDLIHEDEPSDTAQT